MYLNAVAPWYWFLNRKLFTIEIFEDLMCLTKSENILKQERKWKRVIFLKDCIRLLARAKNSKRAKYYTAELSLEVMLDGCQYGARNWPLLGFLQRCASRALKRFEMLFSFEFYGNFICFSLQMLELESCNSFSKCNICLWWLLFFVFESFDCTFPPSNAFDLWILKTKKEHGFGGI